MNLVDKCRKVVEALSREKGAFTLFALFEHDVYPGQWDLLFSAPWLTPGRAAIRAIVDSLAPELTPQEWQSIVSIVPLDPSMPYVQWIARHYEVESDVREITNAVLDGVFVSHGYILAAKNRPLEVPSPAAARVRDVSRPAPRRRARPAPAEKAA